MTEKPEPPPFAAPWEAQVFALVVCLQERGLFAWSEWAETLGAVIRPNGGPEATADYGHWLQALERILAGRGIAGRTAIEARQAAFQRAAEATPHGQPILLSNDPLHP
jgi:nitrile hydratase accessory protein